MVFRIPKNEARKMERCRLLEEDEVEDFFFFDFDFLGTSENSEPRLS